MSDNNNSSSDDDEDDDDESYRETEEATTAINTAIPIAASLGASPIKRKPKRKRFHLPEGFPKRPLSAYNLFFKETRAEILSKSKSGKVAFGGVAKEIGARWNSLPPRDRSKYEQQAAQDLLRYRAEITTFEKNLAVQQQKAEEDAEDAMEQDGDKKPAALPSTQRKRSSDLPVIAIPEHVTTTESERMAQFSALPPKIQEGLLRYAQQTWGISPLMESSSPVPALSSAAVAQAQSPATLPHLPTNQASSTSASGSSLPARTHPPPQQMYSRRLLTANNNAGALPPASNDGPASAQSSLEEQLASLLGVQQHSHPPALAASSNNNAIQDLAALLLPPAPSSDPTGMLLQALLGGQQSSSQQHHQQPSTESLPELLIQTLLQQQQQSLVPAPLPFWPQQQQPQQQQPSSSVVLEDLLRQLSANNVPDGSIHVNPQNPNHNNDNARNKHPPDARR